MKLVYILSELEWLAHHHLNTEPLVRHSRIDADYDAFGPGPEAEEAETDIPLHVGMQRIEVPFGCHAPDFDKGHELKPLDSNVFLNPRPPVKRVPAGYYPQLGRVINSRFVVETLGRVAAQSPDAAQGRAGIRRRPVCDLTVRLFIPGRRIRRPIVQGQNCLPEPV